MNTYNYHQGGGDMGKVRFVVYEVNKPSEVTVLEINNALYNIMMDYYKNKENKENENDFTKNESK
jgi:hypothetical protein